ncbi:putative uncharacterized protein [Fusobacterium sp. CAG:439]|nr:putative uncharacterized protein [Fusobacterium sp. CAG:439]
MLNGNLQKIDARKEVKIMLSKKAWTMKMLAEKLSQASGKYYSPQNLNYRLAQNKLKLYEMGYICQILGFKLEFIEEV